MCPADVIPDDSNTTHVFGVNEETGEAFLRAYKVSVLHMVVNLS